MSRKSNSVKLINQEDRKARVTCTCRLVNRCNHILLSRLLLRAMIVMSIMLTVHVYNKQQYQLEMITRFETAFWSGGVGAWYWDLTNDKLYWDDKMLSMWEVDDNDHIVSYQSFIDRVHPDDRAFVNKVVEESIRLRVPYQYTFRIVSPDGIANNKVITARGAITPDGKSFSGVCTLDNPDSNWFGKYTEYNTSHFNN